MGQDNVRPTSVAGGWSNVIASAHIKHINIYKTTPRLYQAQKFGGLWWMLIYANPEFQQAGTGNRWQVFSRNQKDIYKTSNFSASE